MSKTYLITAPTHSFMNTAQGVAARIGHLLNSIHAGELVLATGYVQLGVALLTVRENKYWLALGFKNFGEYVKTVRDKIHTGRTQLYLYISTVEKLLPSVSETELTEIGISKALELKRVVSQTGEQPPQDLIDLALERSTTREILKGEVYKLLHLTEDTKGTYFDFGGCYVSDEEQAELQRGFDVAVKVDPPIPNSWPEHAQKKEIMFRLIREFLATYEAVVSPIEDVKW